MLEIAAGIVLGVLALVVLWVLLLLAIRVWEEIQEQSWIGWTLGITVVGLYLIWLLDRPR